MLRTIVEAAVDSAPDMELVALLPQSVDVDSIQRAVVDHEIDVLLIGARDARWSPLVDGALRARPSMGVLAVSYEGRRGVLHELRPAFRPLEVVSRETLLQAIRATRHAEGFRC